MAGGGPPGRIKKMTELAIKTESLTVFHADALHPPPTFEGGGKVCQSIITDPPYESLNKHRSTGTTTRLRGHRDPEKRSGWFDTITNEQLYFALCEFARLLPKLGHAWVMADNETQAIIQGFVREGDTGFAYVKSYPLLKMRTDGLAPKMGTGYHLKASHEYVVLCEKRLRSKRRSWTDEQNNRPDYFTVPWTGAVEGGGVIDDLNIPADVATCPDCEGTLTADVYEWDGETERPTGWHLWCDRERASLETHSLMLADGQPVGRFVGCRRSYQDGVEMDAAIEEWLDEEYPNPERGDLSCAACGSEQIGPAEVRDSRRTGTLIRCRSCILSVAPEMLTADQIAYGRAA